MEEHIKQYIALLNQQYRTGLTTEHSFRPALQQLLQACTGCVVVNEQSHIDCGAPDLTLLSKLLPIAYVEAKDLEDGDLDGRKKNKEQFSRYKESLDTIIFTDYLDFHLYEHGEWVQSVRLAEIQKNKICLSDKERFCALMEHIKAAKPQAITSASKLAQLMAGKARLLRDIIEQALIQDGDSPTELRGYMEAFRQVLIHDITPKQFADIYAQTIAYGMFAARLHDATPDDFTRAEAANLIPKSNPFLRKVFQQIAGYDLDERIAWIVDDLVSAFAATDMEKIMQGFGKSTGQTDSMLHFYEDFLFQYDPAAKKQCGVYYTPQPVVNFIVRAVDDILRQEFGLPMGLADTSKVEVEREIEQDLKHRKEKIQVHRVQVLDPATGTGTFLAETVRQIKRDLGGQMGAWPQYVPEHLLPRLHGFELMMAPYTIAHLKLDMEIGIPAQQRLKVYLTNSLEECNEDAGTLFGNYLAQEANAASAIKRDAPVMIVMGNPPYSGISQNNGEWITNLLSDYKKEPGGVMPLKERKIWLNDDYCKFIRLGQHYVDRNKEGVLAYICNNGFLDNPTFRGMRWSLLNSFDKIYIVNLHGNSMKHETAPDGSKDENVFDIMVGTSINIFVKTGHKKQGELADVYYADLYGERTSKYDFLNAHKLSDTEFKRLDYSNPLYLLTPQNEKGKQEYEQGFRVDELMKTQTMGFVSANDKLNISFTSQEQVRKIHDLLEMNEHDWRVKYERVKDARDWTYLTAKNDAKSFADKVQMVSYRPFDTRYTYYTGNSRGLYSSPQSSIMRHLQFENIGLCCVRINSRNEETYFVADNIVDKTILSSKDNANVFPLYLYPEDGSIDSKRVPNLNPQIVKQIAESLKYLYVENEDLFVEPAPPYEGYFRPIDLFDYIYGVLHSPAYREKYKEFLKVDFPRIPYPKNGEEFSHYRFYGEQLRELHLMHNVPDSPVTFPVSGSMEVEQIRFVPGSDLAATPASTLSVAPELNSGRVYINAEQYFDGVPEEAWIFYIGGYQPAQKWLKDRKGRTLSYDDILHYSQIISILLETNKLMKEIDG